MGQSKIRRVVYLYFISFNKTSSFHIHVIYSDALGFSGVGVGTHISNILFFINAGLRHKILLVISEIKEKYHQNNRYLPVKAG